MQEVHKFFFGDDSFLETLFSKERAVKDVLPSKIMEEVPKNVDLVQKLKHNNWNNFSISMLTILLTRKNTCLHVSAGGKVAAFEVAALIRHIDSNVKLNDLIAKRNFLLNKIMK
jgi:hypothetical protein